MEEPADEEPVQETINAIDLDPASNVFSTFAVLPKNDYAVEEVELARAD